MELVNRSSVSLKQRSKSCVEAGLNTSTVAVRVVKGEEKEPIAWGYNRATRFLGDINSVTWPSSLGDS
jgi:hypothetical protein